MLGVLWDPFHKTSGEMRGAGPFLTSAFAGPEVETADEGPSPLLPPLAPSSTVRAPVGTLTSARPQPSQPPTVYHTCKQSPSASPHT